MPPEFLNASVNVWTSGAPETNVAKAATERLSVNPNISLTSAPSSDNCFNAGINVSTDVIDPPKRFDNVEFESANFKNIPFKDVPAVDASIPAFVNIPNNAVVPSSENPNCFEIAPTFGNAVLNFSKSNDVLENAFAKISVTRPASDASNE